MAKPLLISSWSNTTHTHKTLLTRIIGLIKYLQSYVDENATR